MKNHWVTIPPPKVRNPFAYWRLALQEYVVFVNPQVIDGSATVDGEIHYQFQMRFIPPPSSGLIMVRQGGFVLPKNWMWIPI